jgi:hypothetical protein
MDGDSYRWQLEYFMISFNLPVLIMSIDGWGLAIDVYALSTERKAMQQQEQNKEYN